MTERGRQTLVDALGLGILLLGLADYLRPELWWVPTIAAGGDTPCHYPTFLYLRDHLLPNLRLHGWYPGTYLGQPMLLYYFPFPFLLMSALSLVMPAPVAFKLGVIGGVFFLPVAAYVACRLMRFRGSVPLLAAAGAFVFLFVEDNPLWGGTLASTLSGEFSYTYGLGFALIFLAVAYRAYSQDQGYWMPAALLALTALAHGYAVLWAGLSVAYFLYGARRPWRTLGWLAAVGGIAFALVACWLLPLLADWGWTTPYADPWIRAGWRNLFPPLLWPLAVLALGGLVWTLVTARREGGADHRVLYLAHAVLAAAALAAAGPALGIIDIRFVPFAHASVAILGGATAGRMVDRLRLPGAAALALVIATVVGCDVANANLRQWSLWTLRGLEATDLWPAFSELAERLRGSAADPRVAVEYSAVHERAGSIRMYETLPLFAGRSTLEGVYNQASLSTHAIYYLASEMSATPPNPFRSRHYSAVDVDAAIAHLRLFNARDIVTVSAALASGLSARGDVRRIDGVPPYSVFQLQGQWGYVAPMTHEPVRSEPRRWRDKAYRWFTRKPLSPAHLVFTEDRRFGLIEGDEYLAPAEVSLPNGTVVQETIEPERITVRTNRVGHPLLVKVSYHPRWTVTGARGPYLVSPSLMMVVPEQETVTLSYSRTAADTAGAALSIGVLLAGVGLRFLRRPARPARVRLAMGTLGCDGVAEPRRWGGLVPAMLMLLMGASRLLPAATADRADEVARLHEYASRAYDEERYAAAAEYSRNALVAHPHPELRRGLLALRGESLLQSQRPGDAQKAWSDLLADPGPYLEQALFGLAVAAEADGNTKAATDAAARLLRQNTTSPWVQRLRAEYRDLEQRVLREP